MNLQAQLIAIFRLKMYIFIYSNWSPHLKEQSTQKVNSLFLTLTIQGFIFLNYDPILHPKILTPGVLSCKSGNEYDFTPPTHHFLHNVTVTYVILCDGDIWRRLLRGRRSPRRCLIIAPRHYM